MDIGAIPFDVRNKDFDINFTASHCSKVKNGHCPLEEGTQFNDELLAKEWCRNDIHYCPALLYRIKEDGFISNNYSDAIMIDLYKCGHYIVSEGRHRVCIAQKSDIEIQAIYAENNEAICRTCMQRNMLEEESPSTKDK